MKKTKEAFLSLDSRSDILVYGCKTESEASEEAKQEYPELFDADEDMHFTITDTVSYKCLDCLSRWISDDVCGECGEYRLSKRAEQVYFIETHY